MALKGKDHITLLLTHITYLGLDIHTGATQVQAYLFFFNLKSITGNTYSCYLLTSLSQYGPLLKWVVQNVCTSFEKCLNEKDSVYFLTPIEHMTSFLKLLLQMILSNTKVTTIISSLCSVLYLMERSPAHDYFLSPTSAQWMSDYYNLLLQIMCYCPIRSFNACIPCCICKYHINIDNWFCSTLLHNKKHTWIGKIILYLFMFYFRKCCWPRLLYVIFMWFLSHFNAFCQWWPWILFPFTLY